MTELFLALALLLLLSGAPLFAILLAAAFTGFAWAEIPLTIVAVELTRLTDTPLLVSLPLFAFAGYVLAEGRSPRRAPGWGSLGHRALLCPFYRLYRGLRCNPGGAWGVALPRPPCRRL